MRYDISFACSSHIGKCRQINQDNFLCINQYLKSDTNEIHISHTGRVSTSSPCLFGVFDGMGGEERGEMAAYIAAKDASHISSSLSSSADALIDFCYKANRDICTYAKMNQISSMGTTAAMLLFDPKGICLCNIGDSKIFRLSPDGMEQLSEDHLGIAPFGMKPPLSQNLGIPEDELIITPYTARGYYHAGDKYLICSDGLSDMVSTGEITCILGGSSPDAAVSLLIEAALEHGGKDNITVIAIEILRPKTWLNKLFRK